MLGLLGILSGLHGGLYRVHQLQQHLSGLHGNVCERL